MPPPIKRAATLRPGQLRHVLRVTTATSRHPERDCLAILMTHCAGLRVTELARLEVRDVLWTTGRLREEVQLRAEITKNCKSRTVFLTNPTLREAAEAWIKLRQAKSLGTDLLREQFRGLSPYTSFILTHKGRGFELVCKRRTLPDGREATYWAADALEARFRELYRAAGIATSSHSGRRTFASALLRKGVTLEQAAILLGHVDEDVTAVYIAVDKVRLREMYEVAL